MQTLHVHEGIISRFLCLVKVCFSCSVSDSEKCIETHDLGALFSSALKEKILLMQKRK